LQKLMAAADATGVTLYQARKKCANVPGSVRSRAPRSSRHVPLLRQGRLLDDAEDERAWMGW
jgi:hypothetical protein